jgi:hypothetical protein
LSEYLTSEKCRTKGASISQIKVLKVEDLKEKGPQFDENQIVTRKEFSREYFLTDSQRQLKISAYKELRKDALDSYRTEFDMNIRVEYGDTEGSAYAVYTTSDYDYNYKRQTMMSILKQLADTFGVKGEERDQVKGILELFWGADVMYSLKWRIPDEFPLSPKSDERWSFVRIVLGLKKDEIDEDEEPNNPNVVCRDETTWTDNW